MPQIYCCFIQFILFLLYPRSTKFKRGGTLVSLCPSVRLWTESCPLCIVHNTSGIHFIFTHLIDQLQKGCRMLSFVKIWIFGNFLKFAHFTLPYVHTIWMLKVDSASELLLQQLFIIMMIPLDILLNKLSGFGQYCNFVFLANAFNYAFPLCLCGGIKDKVDSFLFQSLRMSGKSICCCILTTLRTD